MSDVRLESSVRVEAMGTVESGTQASGMGQPFTKFTFSR